jgi:hypothetical protein
VDESNTSFVASNVDNAAGYATDYAFASRNSFTAGSVAGVVTTNTLYPTYANILNGYNGTDHDLNTQHVEVVLPSMGASGTVKKLIIVWRNDGSAGTQPPAALDNFFIDVITCSAPDTLAVPMATITTDNAVVNWTAVAEAQEYIIQWKPISVSSWDDPVVESGNTTDTFFNVQNLTASTQYNVRVRGVCTPGADSSLWAQINFLSACGTITITSTTPFTEGFENAWLPITGAGNQPAPPCWTVIDKGEPSTTYNGYWWKQGTYSALYISAHSGEGHAYCYTDYGTSPHNDWLITPQIALTGNEGLKFWAMRSNEYTNEPDEISIFISDEDITLDASGMGQYDTLQGFHRIFNQLLPSGTWQQYEINLNQYSGNRYIAFVREGTPDGYDLRLDDIEIAELPACMKPTNLAITDIQPTEARISWTNGNEADTDWLLLYKTASATTYDTLDITENPYLLQGLNPGNTYNVMLITNCGTDSSETSSVLTFTTFCLLAEIPYTQNFDSRTSLSPCWTTFGSFMIEIAYATSQPHTLRFGGQGTNVAVLPVFNEDVNTARISFVLRREGVDETYGSGPMDIGYLTDITDASSFVAVMTDILTVAGVNTPFDTALSAFPAGITNIAFRQTTSSYWYYWLDNVFVYDPNCLPVNAFATQNITATSADITWSDEGSSSVNWNVELYSTAQESPTVGGGDVSTTTVVDTVANISNLAPNTTYYLYVKNDCGWSAYSFTTPCVAITTLPYTENFDSYTAGYGNPLPNCWTGISTYSAGYPFIVNYYWESSPNSLELYNYGSTTHTTAFLPEFGIPLNNLALQFSALFGYSSAVIDIVVATDPLNSSTWTLVGTIPLTGTIDYTFDTYSFSLGDYQGSGTYIGFRNNSNGSFNLDNIKVSDCAVPTNLHVENLTATSTNLVWSDLGQITNWTLKVSSTPLTDPTNETGNLFDNPVIGTPTQNVGSLTEETLYYVYLRNNCDTNWVTFTFTTPASCAFPTGLTATPTSISTATLTWDALGMTNWNLKVSSTPLTDPATESGDVLDGDVTGTSSQVITDLTVGVTYYWYVQSACGSAWANGTFALQYCTPNPTSVDNPGGIHHVTFGIIPSVDQATTPPAAAPFYNDNANLIGGIFEGETTFSISVTQAYSSGYITKIWVDWNNDLIFDNVTELVAGPSEDVSGVQNFTATIPANTPLGSYRLRIGSHDNADFGALIPCYEGTYGSYEDYTLQIVPQPTCLYPTNLTVDNITSSSATVTWTAPATAPTNGYQVLVSTSATQPTGSEPEIQQTMNTSLAIDNLDSITSYYVWVRSDCGGEDYSPWGAVSFTTLCPPSVPIPYTQNFDANAYLPSCWTMFGSLSISTDYATSYPNTLRFNGGATTIAVLPIFDVDVNTARLGFVLRRESMESSGSMSIGYLTDISDTNSFVTVMPDILIIEDENITFDTALTAFPAGIKNIAFRQVTTFNYWYWLDNINVYPAPITCPAPTNVVTGAVTSNSANISWTENGTATQWQVAWKKTTESIWNYDIATATTYGISGLAAATNYEVQVRAICGEADTSDWSDAATFTTLTCNKPANVEITGTTATSIVLSWEATNGESKWNVIWKSTTATSGSAIVENTPATTLTELTPATDYEICVVAICTEGVESAEECELASTTAIHDITLANSLQLYPNPTTGELRIKNYELQEGDNIEIYNMLGQKQQLTTIHYPLSTINVSHLSAGVYTVKIGGYVGKFVKK